MSYLMAIRESVHSGNSRESVKFTKMELEKGTPWGEILRTAMLPAMNQVGEEFSKGVAFLPELIAAGNAMTKSVEAIKADIPSMGLGEKGVFVIGTIFGDVHDIGKNIVKICLEGAGFRVADLGTDVSPESFARACRENKADLAGISAPSQLHHAEYGRGGEGDPRRKPRDQNHGGRRAADRGDRPENRGRRLCAGRLPGGEKSRGAARREEVERMEPECRSSNTRTETSGPS